MLGVTDLRTYVLGTIAIVLLPGPNSLFVLSTAARHGVRTGYRAALGVFLGDWVLVAATAAGVGSLLRTNPALFLVVKYAGAAYLAYVGITMTAGAIRRWRRREDGASPPAPAEATSGEAEVSPGSIAATGAPRPFRRALVISVLNPKAILFYLSFFIQFLDPDYPYPAVSVLLLGTIIQCFSALYLSGLIFGGTFLAAQFGRRRRLASGLGAGVGAVFLGFSLKLATASLG